MNDMGINHDTQFLGQYTYSEFYEWFQKCDSRVGELLLNLEHVYPFENKIFFEIRPTIKEMKLFEYYITST